jgi:hypothetical protein
MASHRLQELSGAAENDYERHKREMEDVVRQYITILLSGEGRDNSWDPLWNPSDLTINVDGVNWIHSHRVCV